MHPICLIHLPAIVSKETRIKGERYSCDVYLLNHWVLLECKVLCVPWRARKEQVNQMTPRSLIHTSYTFRQLVHARADDGDQSEQFAIGEKILHSG